MAVMEIWRIDRRMAAVNSTLGIKVFLYSVILTEYVAIETEGVCMSVCMCVCVWKLYSQNGCVYLDETLHQ